MTAEPERAEPERAVPERAEPEGAADASSRPAISPDFPALIGTLIGTAGLAIWAVSGWLNASAGLDLTDEGFYLLSYRWWSTEYRNFTGAQFIYGPLFESLGWNIGDFRRVGLVVAIALHLAFGLAFARWLRAHRPHLRRSRWTTAAITTLVAASGAMSAAWLPASPSYNTLSLHGTIAATTALLVQLRRAEASARWLPVAPAMLGAAMMVAGLAKWPSTLLTAPVLLVVLVLARSDRWWKRALDVAASAAGAAVVWGWLSAAIDLPRFLDEFGEVTTAINRGTNDPLTLWRFYLNGIRYIATTNSGLVIAFLGACVLVGVARWLRVPLALITVVIGAMAVRSLTDIILPSFRAQFLVAAIGLPPLVYAASTAFARRWLAAAPGTGTGTKPEPEPEPELESTDLETTGDQGVAPAGARWHTWLVGLALAALPATFAAGTGNAILVLASAAFAFWGALGLLALSAAPPDGVAQTATSAALVGAIAFVPAWAAADGLLRHPYRVDPVEDSTVEVSSLPPLAGLRFGEDTADGLQRFGEALAPLVQEPGRRVLAYDESAGLVLALGGRSVGEPWYSFIDHRRTADGIRSACPDHRPPWGSRPPILLLRRNLTTVDTAALRYCGIDLWRDYVSLVPRGDDWDELTVLVHRRDADRLLDAGTIRSTYAAR